MSSEEITMVNAFRKKYKDLCKGKDNKIVLLYIYFVEAGRELINEELKKQNIITDYSNYSN